MLSQFLKAIIGTRALKEANFNFKLKRYSDGSQQRVNDLSSVQEEMAWTFKVVMDYGSATLRCKI